MVVSEEQSRKASAPTVVTEQGSVTDASEVQDLKLPVPHHVVTESGNTMDVSEEQS